MRPASAMTPMVPMPVSVLCASTCAGTTPTSASGMGSITTTGVRYEPYQAASSR
jgi:hypothetical protein